MTLASDHGAIDTLGLDTKRAKPAGLAKLALSPIVVALASLLTCCLAAAIFALSFAAFYGTEGLAEFMQRLRFDVPLRTRGGALIVSLLYVGASIGTLTCAVHVGRRRWRQYLALDRGPRLTLGDAILAAAAFAYAAGERLYTLHALDRHLVTSGPTDFLLIGTITVNLCLFAPVAEELFFRGWVYTALRARLSFFPTFLLVTALFTAFHWDASHRRIFLVLPLAVALGLLRESTGSIRSTIVIHAAYNFIIVAITLAET